MAAVQSAKADFANFQRRIHSLLDGTRHDRQGAPRTSLRSWTGRGDHRMNDPLSTAG
jgi:hypothetical protein